MKHTRFKYLLIIFVAIMLSITNHSYANEHEKSGEHEESASGATFKPGKGVSISGETQQILGLEIADVIEEQMPKIIHLNVQIFGEIHRFSNSDINHSGCDVHGSGFLAPDQVLLVEPKQPVKVTTADHRLFDGFVISTQKNLGQSETEVLVGVKDTDTGLKEGDFVAATIFIPRDTPVAVIPSSSLLRTAEGSFVYVVNGDAFYRTPVQVGSETDEKIEIIDGLFAGDQVVTKPVETLWIIELRATKGGGHSH